MSATPHDGMWLRGLGRATPSGGGADRTQHGKCVDNVAGRSLADRQSDRVSVRLSARVRLRVSLDWVVRFSNTITILRPPTDVFAFLADPANLPSWNYAITSVKLLTPGPPGQGTRFLQSRRLPRPGDEELEITEFAPPTRLALTGTVGPFRGQLSYELDEREGATQLINHADLEARGVARLLAPAATGRIRSAVAENLQVLKGILER